MKIIVHITQKTEWERALFAGTYQAPSLEKQGFIHCSLPSQVVGVANSNFRYEQDLVLLEIDTSILASPLKFEDLYNEGAEYPHLYGPLNIEAVKKVVSFAPNTEGYFELPENF